MEYNDVILTLHVFMKIAQLKNWYLRIFLKPALSI